MQEFELDLLPVEILVEIKDVGLSAHIGSRHRRLDADVGHAFKCAVPDRHFGDIDAPRRQQLVRRRHDIGRRNPERMTDVAAVDHGPRYEIVVPEVTVHSLHEAKTQALPDLRAADPDAVLCDVRHGLHLKAERLAASYKKSRISLPAAPEVKVLSDHDALDLKRVDQKICHKRLGRVRLHLVVQRQLEQIVDAVDIELLDSLPPR